MKNILVTGGTSFIGKHVIAQLMEKEYTVRTTVRDKSKSDQIISDLKEHLLNMMFILKEKYEFQSSN